MTTIQGKVVENIIRELITDGNYRNEVQSLLDVKFFNQVTTQGSRIIDNGVQNKLGEEDLDWYRKKLLDSNNNKKDIAYAAGLNLKTIYNLYGSQAKSVVEEKSLEHYKGLKDLINTTSDEEEVKINIQIEKDGETVDLGYERSLIFINSLAVRRAGISGGLWSTAGKQVEGPLMLALCKMFNVDESNYAYDGDFESLREIDFYLISDNSKEHKCEVKLMGRGNPESADAIYGRDTDVFVGDKLSELNKNQLDNADVEWVALDDEEGYQRFEKVLEQLGINKGEVEDIEKSLNEALEEMNLV